MHLVVTFARIVTFAWRHFCNGITFTRVVYLTRAITFVHIHSVSKPISDTNPDTDPTTILT